MRISRIHFAPEYRSLSGYQETLLEYTLINQIDTSSSAPLQNAQKILPLWHVEKNNTYGSFAFHIDEREYNICRENGTYSNRLSWLSRRKTMETLPCIF